MSYNEWKKGFEDGLKGRNVGAPQPGQPNSGYGDQKAGNDFAKKQNQK